MIEQSIQPANIQFFEPIPTSKKLTTELAIIEKVVQENPKARAPKISDEILEHMMHGNYSIRILCRPSTGKVDILYKKRLIAQIQEGSNGN